MFQFVMFEARRWLALSMMFELSTDGTMPPEGFSRMRPPFESSGPFALARDDRTEIARHGRRAEDGRDGKDASRTRYGHEAANQGTGFRNQVSVNSQEESPTRKPNGVRIVSDPA